MSRHLSKKQIQHRKKAKEEAEHRIRKLKAHINKVAKSSQPSRTVKSKLTPKEKFDASAGLKYHDPCGVKTSDKIDHLGVKPSIMDRLTLDKESPATRQAIQEKAMRVAPASNKGGYELIPLGQIPSTKKWSDF
jgi:hypothetical protein